MGLVAILSAGFLDLLSMTIANVALPTIAVRLPATPAQAQGILTAYTVTFAVGLITGARLGRILGLRRTFILGTVGFAATSLLCGLSGSAVVLILARALQGLCAAVMVPQILALIQVIYPAGERARPMAAFSGMLGAAASLGPIVGGLLVQAGNPQISWRAVFLINVPLALAAAVVTARTVPAHRSAQTVRLDLLGLFLSAAAVLLLLAGLAGFSTPDHAVVDLGAVLAGAALLVAFLAQQRGSSLHGQTPLVPLRLQVRGIFRAAAVVQLLFFIPVMGFSFVLTQYLQTHAGYSPLATGLIVLPWSILVGVGAGLGTSVLLPRLGRTVITGGLLVMAVGIAAVAVVIAAGPAVPTWWQFLPGAAVGGFGMGLVVAPLTEMALSEIPVQLASEASGVYNSVGQLSAALGFATLGTLYFALAAPASGPDDPVYATAAEAALFAGSGILIIAVFAARFLPKTVPHPATAHTGSAQSR